MKTQKTIYRVYTYAGFDRPLNGGEYTERWPGFDNLDDVRVEVENIMAEETAAWFEVAKLTKEDGSWSGSEIIEMYRWNDTNESYERID